jgi:competence protein ComEC
MFAETIRVVDSTSTVARMLADARARLGAVLRSAAPGDSGVLLTGLVTGDDAGFSPARERAFMQTGTTHLTAVSGSNLALVAGILATAGAMTVGRYRLVWQALTLIGIWSYAFLSGAQAPAVRAAIVASAAVLAFRFGRRPDFPTLIVLAAGGLALLDPGHVEALGFRLSVAASLALAVVLPGMVQTGRFRAVPSALAGVVAAQLATLPLLLPVFGTISLLSVPANLRWSRVAATRRSGRGAGQRGGEPHPGDRRSPCHLDRLRGRRRSPGAGGGGVRGLDRRRAGYCQR